MATTQKVRRVFFLLLPLLIAIFSMPGGRPMSAAPQPVAHVSGAGAERLAPARRQAAQDEDGDRCTSILVGKLASADGATMTSHSCDSTTDRTWMNIVPNQKHKPAEMAKVYHGPKETTGPDDPERVETGQIPQAPETYAYLNAAYPIMNEHQLAIGETTFGGKRELVSAEGIIDCPELYRLVLERAKTSREAIRIADELTKQYGYNDYGEAFTFADPKETWLFEILGPGRGKKGAVWAAVRIRGALADTDTWPSGTRTAAHTAPFLPLPGPTISNSHTSFGSANVNASPQSL